MPPAFATRCFGEYQLWGQSATANHVCTDGSFRPIRKWVRLPTLRLNCHSQREIADIIGREFAAFNARCLALSAGRDEETASRSNKETNQACRAASCHVMTQAASPSAPSGHAAISTNEGDRSRATKTRHLHPLRTVGGRTPARPVKPTPGSRRSTALRRLRSADDCRYPGAA